MRKMFQLAGLHPSLLLVYDPLVWLVAHFNNGAYHSLVPFTSDYHTCAASFCVCFVCEGTQKGEGAKPEDGPDAGRQLTTKDLLKAVRTCLRAHSVAVWLWPPIMPADALHRLSCACQTHLPSDDGIGRRLTLAKALIQRASFETLCGLWPEMGGARLQVGKEGGLRREIPAFHDRWVTGRGCASLTAAYDAVNPIK